MSRLSKGSILEAAVKLAEESGPQKVSLRGVAAKAGCAPPSIYHYFENKAELMQGIFDTAICALEELTINCDSHTDVMKKISQFWLERRTEFVLSFMNPFHPFKFTDCDLYDEILKRAAKTKCEAEIRLASIYGVLAVSINQSYSVDETNELLGALIRELDHD